MLKEKKNFLGELIAFLILVYLFFLSRRGGSSKDTVSTIIMLLTLIYSYREGIKKYLNYKKEIIICPILIFDIIFYSLIVKCYNIKLILMSKQKFPWEFFIFLKGVHIKMWNLCLWSNLLLWERALRILSPQNRLLQITTSTSL